MRQWMTTEESPLPVSLSLCLYLCLSQVSKFSLTLSLSLFMLYSSVLLFPASKMLHKPKQRRQRNRDLSRTSSFSAEKQKSGTCVIPKFRVTQSRDVESVGPDAMMRPTGFPEWGLCQFSPCCDMGENFSLSLTHSLSLSLSVL